MGRHAHVRNHGIEQGLHADDQEHRDQSAFGGGCLRHQPRSIRAPEQPTRPITQPESPTVNDTSVAPELSARTVAMEPIPAADKPG